MMCTDVFYWYVRKHAKFVNGKGIAICTPAGETRSDVG